jgi:hypothetical protein
MLRRAFEPSNLRAISLRYQARIVSGRATLATSARTLRPNRWPISASVARSAFESCSRPLNWAVRIRFSVTRYSFCANSSLSTVPVTKASMRAQFIRPPRQPTHDLCSTNPSQHLPVRLCRQWANHRLFYSFNFLAFRNFPRSSALSARADPRRSAVDLQGSGISNASNAESRTDASAPGSPGG